MIKSRLLDISEHSLIYIPMSKPRPSTSGLGRPANPQARARRRHQILNGARKCFQRRGFHASTTTEISVEAGVGVANLYQYFPTKDDLVKALIEDDLSKDLALVELVDQAATMREGLEHVTRLLASDPTLIETTRLHLEIHAEAARNRELATMVEASNARMLAAMSNLVVRRQREGEVRADADPVMVASLIIALFDGLYGQLVFGSVDAGTLTRAANKMIIDAFTS